MERFGHLQAVIMTLRDEILTGLKSAECAPFVVTNDMPKDADYMAKDQAIADILNTGRAPKIVTKLLGDGDIALALGIPDGPVFLLQLETIAETAPTEQTPPEIVAQIAVARQAWRSLCKSGLDAGLPSVRTALDLFVGTLLTQGQADAVKALAEVPDVVTASDVSRALRVLEA